MSGDEAEPNGIAQLQSQLDEKWKLYRAEHERQLDMYKAQVNAQKELNRVADIRSSVAQHSKPQIKRSVAFIKKLLHKVEDARERIYKFTDVEAVTADNVEEANSAFSDMTDLLNSLEELLDHELSMNCIASREKLGWLVVKMLERDPLFEHDDDGSKTKEVRSAAYRAGQIVKDRRFQFTSYGAGYRGKGRGGFVARGRGGNAGGYGGGYGGGGYSGGGYGGGSAYQDMRNNFSGMSVGLPKDSGSSIQAGSAGAPVCFRCGNPGHYQRFCRATQPGPGQGGAKS